MTAITISGFRLRNGVKKEESLYLICKAPPLSEIRKKSWKSSVVFDREIYIYTKLLPAFVRFQREKGLSEAESFLSFPKVYMCKTSEEHDTYLLIMENLRVKNFAMWPKEKMIPLDHELLALKELAEFHAISFAMKDQRPNEFAPFKELKDIAMEIVFGGSIGTFIEQSVDRLVQAVEKPEHKKFVENLRKRYLETIGDFLRGPSTEEWAVVRHGDFWNNNFMFQYSDDTNEEVKGINFLDWQISHFSPPALDILYNVFSSTDKEFRDKHYDTLLKTYYASLCEMIQKLGSDPNKLYPKHIFHQQLRKYAEYGLVMTPLIILIRVAKETDVSNLDEFAQKIEKGENVELIHKFSDETQREYSRLVNGIVTDLVDYGYIQIK